MTEWMLDIDIDGQKATGINLSQKPSKITLTLTKIEPRPPQVDVVGTKELVVP